MQARPQRPCATPGARLWFDNVLLALHHLNGLLVSQRYCPELRGKTGNQEPKLGLKSSILAFQGERREVSVLPAAKADALRHAAPSAGSSGPFLLCKN